jgi:hypothetical protein
MPITHVNAKGKTYYLHQGTTKTGKPKYHFSPKSEGNLVETMPEGFEIYENPNAQVFIRKIPPQFITDEEKAIVEEGMRKYSDVDYFKIDVKGNAIVVYTADQDVGAIVNIFKDFAPAMEDAKIRNALLPEIRYSPMLQFVLIDDKKRTFTTQRYCFRGSIDDWIDIDYGKLEKLVRAYVKHLGKESYYELF